jgi:hypothetical protein
MVYPLMLEDFQHPITKNIAADAERLHTSTVLLYERFVDGTSD